MGTRLGHRCELVGFVWPERASAMAGILTIAPISVNTSAVASVAARTNQTAPRQAHGKDPAPLQLGRTRPIGGHALNESIIERRRRSRTAGAPEKEHWRSVARV